MKARIERWIYGGAGVGIAEDSKEVSLPFTLPDEMVEADAGALTILEPAFERVMPRCPHFGICGGCQYQQAEYATQVRLKGGILKDTLRTAGVMSFPEPQLHTAEPWGYRNRIRLRLAAVEGQLRIGYSRRGSFEFLPIGECPIAAPLLLRAAMALLSTLASSGELTAWSSKLREVELFTAPDESALQMTLFAARDLERPSFLPMLCERLKAEVPELSGVGVLVVGTSGKQERPGSTWGAAGLRYPAAGRSYWVSRGSFFQINRFLVDELVRLVTTDRSGRLAWDLYAGVGLFSRALIESFSEVVAVEVEAIDLQSFLKGAGGRAITSTTLDFLQRAVLERDRPDLIVVDPPRAGLGLEVCALLARIAAPVLVYVSCDPVTLARDLKAMIDSGYTVSALHLVDLFPQTFHMEAVVVLNKSLTK